MARGKKIFVVGVLAILTVPVVYVLTHRGTGEPLTAERLAAAEALWKENGPKSYTLDVDVRDARLHVEVKDGKAVAMTTNGEVVTKETVRDAWTVEGMFQSLSEELSNLRHPEATFGVTDPGEVTLRAEFDRTNGYPVTFLRHVQGQTRSVEWHAKLSVN